MTKGYMSQIMGRVPNYRTSRIILGALESLCRFGGFRFRQPWLLGSGSDRLGIEGLGCVNPAIAENVILILNSGMSFKLGVQNLLPQIPEPLTLNPKS